MQRAVCSRIRPRCLAISGCGRNRRDYRARAAVGLAWIRNKSSRRDPIMRRPHDIGGLEAESIETGGHSSEPWEKRVRVMVQQLARRAVPVITRDELRR